MNAPVFPDNLLENIRANPVIAVVVIDDASAAVPMARALLDGGVSGIELTLRPPAALAALTAIRTECPEVLVGLGTVLTTGQVQQAVDLGASFAVSPGLNPEVVQAASAAGLPFAPGIATPSDIEGALALGCRLLKFFPAGPSGGIAYLKSISAPYAHLGVEYIPLGGLDAGNFTDYLALDCVPAVGGSWIAPRDLIKCQDWETITRNAREAVFKAGAAKQVRW
ncbi:MAG: bifunctional 4-hydroxy-2-oxoglutarate aldolase/2-dehydro-3-deoxy-phosphogluconate aldolase [Luteolibacter sp.]